MPFNANVVGTLQVTWLLQKWVAAQKIREPLHRIHEALLPMGMETAKATLLMRIVAVGVLYFGFSSGASQRACSSAMNLYTNAQNRKLISPYDLSTRPGKLLIMKALLLSPAQ